MHHFFFPAPPAGAFFGFGAAGFLAPFGTGFFSFGFAAAFAPPFLLIAVSGGTGKCSGWGVTSLYVHQRKAPGNSLLHPHQPQLQPQTQRCYSD